MNSYSSHKALDNKLQVQGNDNTSMVKWECNLKGIRIMEQMLYEIGWCWA